MHPNALRGERLAEEVAVMKPLTVALLPNMHEVRLQVSTGGTVRVLNNVYAVPRGLKGKIVSARIYEWHIEIWYANQRVETFPRLPGWGHSRVNYRHMIDTLLHKPGGFRDYRYRADLFPQTVFQQAWETLNQRWSPHRADLAYLRILKLAAGGSESDMATVLEHLLASATAWDDSVVAAQLRPTPTLPPALQPHPVNLTAYDQLLGREVTYGVA